MAEEIKAGCARPTSGPVGETAPKPTLEKETEKKEVMSMIQVGKKAPDFTAPSGWKPGKKTLKPGPEMVGNVWKEWKTEMAFD